MALFGGNLADELAETVRRQKEEFDAIDIDTHLQQNQQQSRSTKHGSTQNTKRKQETTTLKSQLSKSNIHTLQHGEHEPDDVVDAFINNDEEPDDTDSDAQHSDNADLDDITHKATKRNNDDDDDEVEYLDVRGQTIFRYSHKPKVSYFDSRRKAKLSSLAYIQNNNVRTRFKNNSTATKKTNANQKGQDVHFKENPFLSQQMLRQNYRIDRSAKDQSLIKDKTVVGKLARNNMQFLEEVIRSKGAKGAKEDQEIEHVDDGVLFDKNRFNRRLRFAIGAPNKRKQMNYAVFQQAMKDKQSQFEQKKRMYLERGLRAPSKLEMKALYSRYGRKKVWNAGKTKAKKGRRSSGKVGSYEYGKSINEW